MEKSELSADELEFNDESNFLDTFYDFHPDWFDKLSEAERSVMQEYYMYDHEMPENIFTYRRKLLKMKPELQLQAQSAYEHLIELIQGG